MEGSPRHEGFCWQARNWRGSQECAERWRSTYRAYLIPHSTLSRSGCYFTAMTLLQFATDRKTGKVKRGALARIADRLDVCKTTVRKWLSGEWTPCPKTACEIQDMIHSRMSLAPEKPGPKPKKCVVQVVEEVHVRNKRVQCTKLLLPTSRK